MRRMMSMLLGLLMLAPFAVLGADEAAGPQDGQPAPEFKLQDQKGNWHTLAQYKGKWVVLYFYPKDMTRGCTIEAHNFETDLPKYNAKNAVIVGVSVDSVDSHKEFCAKQSLTFKLLSDPDKKVVESYGSLNTTGMALRNTFLIDPSGKIAKVWTAVKPEQHSEEVLAALDSMKK